MKKNYILFTVLLSSFFGFSQIDGLVLDYSFDDTTDASGFDNHFINHGATLTEDRFGNTDAAMSFDGVSNYLEIPTDTSYQLDEFPFSVSLWFKIVDTTSISNTLFNNGISNGYGGLMLTKSYSTNAYSSLSSTYGDGSGRGPSDRKSTVTNGGEENVWQNLTVVCNSLNSSQIYLDGVLQETTSSGTGTKLDFGTNPIGYIGLNNTGITNYYMGGSIDELKMWSRALTEEEIQANYSLLPNILGDLVLDYSFSDNLDASGYGNHFINHGATLTEDRFGNTDAAMSFDGVSNYLEIPTDTSYQLDEFPFSVSLWFKIVDTTSISNTLFNNGISNGYGGLMLTKNYSTNAYSSLSSTYGDGSGRGPSDRKSTATNGGEENVWQQITVVCNSLNSNQIYLDGVLQETTSSGTGTKLDFGTNPIGYIGLNNTGITNYYMGGSIDELKMWKKALTLEEVKSNYFPGTTVGVNDFFDVNNEQIINIFPNPSSDKIYFDKTVQNVEVLTNSGNVLISNQNKDELSIADLLPGLYFVRTSIDGESFQTTKLTVK